LPLLGLVPVAKHGSSEHPGEKLEQFFSSATALVDEIGESSLERCSLCG